MAKPQNFKGWKVIVLSFIGAVTFWFFSALGKEYSYRFKHPIKFSYNQDSLIAVAPLPEFVDIDVTGVGWDLFRETNWFGGDPILFTLENPAFTRHLTRATILPVLTDQLSQFRVNFLFTDTLRIDIDRKERKYVRLGIDSAAIRLDPDFRITSEISVEPDSVNLLGPESFLDTLMGKFRVTIRENRIDENFNRSVKLDLPNGFDISSDPPEVNVRFEVARFDQVSIPIRVELLGFPEDSSAYIAEPEVTVSFLVRASQKKETYAEDFKIIADYSMIDAIDSTVSAILMFQPENLLDLEMSPDSLKVTYAE